MSDEIVKTEVEPEVDIDENEPVFFKVKTLTLVASAARILSWVVLAGFVFVFVGNIFNLQELSQGAAFMELIKQAAARIWIYTNLVIPFMTGTTCFMVLLGVSSIIDGLLEVDFNTRETAK
jgi:hypothetical protein